MEETIKWVKWYRILAIIGCVVLVILSLAGGWKESSYTYGYGQFVGHHMGVFFKYAGIGCLIAAVELITSMTICEFFDNVNIIRGAIEELSNKVDDK